LPNLRLRSGELASKRFFRADRWRFNRCVSRCALRRL